MLTLFKILTLEIWADIMESVLVTHPWGWTYFIMEREHAEEEDKKIDMILEKLSKLEKRLEEQEKKDAK